MATCSSSQMLQDSSPEESEKADSRVKVTFSVLERNGGHLWIDLHITPSSAPFEEPWSLAFTWPRIIDPQSLTTGYISDRQGSFYEFSGLPKCDTRDSISMQFNAQGPLEKISDMPDGFYCKFNVDTMQQSNGDRCAPDSSGDGVVARQVGTVDIQFGDMGWTRVTPEPDPFVTTPPGSYDLLIIPYPQSVEVNRDSIGCTLQSQCTISACKDADFAANFIAGLPGKVSFTISVRTTDSGVLLPNVTLGADQTTSAQPVEAQVGLRIMTQWSDIEGDESYEIEISNGTITVFASHSTGFLYGLVSCYQLCQAYCPTSGPHNQLPSTYVRDSPRFRIRQFMLDVSRHFRSVEDIKRMLDQMTLLKMNTFHWHLTDDEGWRLVIKAFPGLAERASWRGDGLDVRPQLTGGPYRYGGFYTKRDVQDVVAYASQRGMTVIPEIDIPGHCFACIKALPELEDPEDQSGNISVQLFAHNTLNPGLNATYNFLDKVLEEVAEMFPGPYVHMGSDEVPKGVWEKSPAALAKVEELGLPGVRGLAGVIMKYAQDVLRKHNKQMMAWQEVLDEPAVDKSAVVCSWQSSRVGKEAAIEGYDVLMAPGQVYYMDMTYNINRDEPGLYWSGTIDIQKTYMHDPLQDITDPEVRQHILGILAPLWTELIPDRDKMDYMLFPRILAVAESAWTDKKDWEGFVGRVIAFCETLERLGVKYRRFGNG